MKNKNASREASVKWDEKFNKGFSLIEVILSLSVLAIITTIYMTSILDNEENIFLNTKRNTANNLAKEGIESVTNIRDNNFTNLIDGSYGLSEINNQVSLIPNEDIKNNYTRKIIVSSINPKLKKIEVVISWQENERRNSNITIVSYLSDQTI